jgi:hypothetical protein
VSLTNFSSHLDLRKREAHDGTMQFAIIDVKLYHVRAKRVVWLHGELT